MEHDNVNHPAHYEESDFRQKPIECIDITRHLSFCRGNAFKYVWRAGKKGDKAQAKEDLEKALWYLGECERENTVDCEGSHIACWVFRLLTPDETDRCLALTQIMLHHDFNAKVAVKQMIHELEEGE